METPITDNASEKVSVQAPLSIQAMAVIVATETADRPPGPLLSEHYQLGPLDICNGRGKAHWNMPGNVAFRYVDLGSKIAENSKLNLRCHVMLDTGSTFRSKFTPISANKPKATKLDLSIKHYATSERKALNFYRNLPSRPSIVVTTLVHHAGTTLATPLQRTKLHTHSAIKSP